MATEIRFSDWKVQQRRFGKNIEVKEVYREAQVGKHKIMEGLVFAEYENGRWEYKVRHAYHYFVLAIRGRDVFGFQRQGDRNFVFYNYWTTKLLKDGLSYIDAIAEFTRLLKEKYGTDAYFYKTPSVLDAWSYLYDVESYFRENWHDLKLYLMEEYLMGGEEKYKEFVDDLLEDLRIHLRRTINTLGYPAGECESCDIMDKLEELEILARRMNDEWFLSRLHEVLEDAHRFQEESYRIAREYLGAEKWRVLSGFGLSNCQIYSIYRQMYLNDHDPADYEIVAIPSALDSMGVRNYREINNKFVPLAEFLEADREVQTFGYTTKRNIEYRGGMHINIMNYLSMFGGAVLPLIATYTNDREITIAPELINPARDSIHINVSAIRRDFVDDFRRLLECLTFGDRFWEIIQRYVSEREPERVNPANLDVDCNGVSLVERDGWKVAGILGRLNRPRVFFIYDGKGWRIAPVEDFMKWAGADLKVNYGLEKIAKIAAHKFARELEKEQEVEMDGI